MYSRRKRIVALAFISAFIVCVFCLQVAASEVENYDFANFTEEDSMAFVESCGIDIPTILMSPEDLPSFTRNVILHAYSYPNIEFCFNFYETQNYAEAICGAVRSYMNLDSVPAVASESTYQLQDNTVLNAGGIWVRSGGAWNPKWANYNCYAFAINRAEQPAFYSSTKQYSPGVMSGVNPWWTGHPDIDDLATLVMSDLQQMGFSNISAWSSIPTVDQSQELICVRLGPGDYHFMRYDLATTAWYHKPGESAVLKYDGTPSSNIPWRYEVSENGIESTFEDYYYSGRIVFIRYSKNQININENEETLSVMVQPGKDVFCELNFAEVGVYTIEITSTNRFTFDIYDEDFDIVLSDQASANLIESLNVAAGKYYLRMNFIPNVPTPTNPNPPPMPVEACAINVSITP